MEGYFQEVLIFKKHLDSSATNVVISKGKKLNGSLLDPQMITYSPLDGIIAFGFKRN